MMGFSAAFYTAKVILLLIVVIISSVHLLKKSKVFSKNLVSLLPWYLYITFSLAYGVFHGFGVDSSIINFYYITPALAILIACYFDTDFKVLFLKNSLIYIAFLICIINVIFVFHGLKYINIPLIDQSTLFGSRIVMDGKVMFRTTSHPALMFLLPFVTCLLFLDRATLKRESFLIKLSFIMGLFVVVMSGRRALQAVFIIGLFFSYGCLKFQTKRTSSLGNFKTVFYLVLVLAFIPILPSILERFLSMDDALNSVISTFTSAFIIEEGGRNVRSDQTFALLSGASDSIFWGHGLSSYLLHHLRSIEVPWSYESVYAAFLYQTGIFGLSLYFFYVYKIIRCNLYQHKFRKNTGDAFFLSVAIGFLLFVIAGSSNPMVYFLWAWIIPIVAFSRR